MISTLITYYVETNLICFLLVGFIMLSYIRESHGLSEAKWFVAALVTVQLYCVADALAAIFKNQVFPGARTVLWISNAIYIAIPLFLIIFWNQYIKEHIRLHFQPGKVFAVLDQVLPLLAAVLCLIALSTPLTHSTFYLDDLNGYHRTVGSYIVPLFAYVFMIYETVKLQLVRRRSSSLQLRQDMGILSVFAIPCILFSLVQVVIYGITVSQVGFTMGLMIVYIGRQQNSISRDELTGLNNRREYQYAVDRAANGSGNAVVIMLDADGFKTINDTYGHQEGDDALRAVALVLKRSCARCKHAGSVAIYRYGGDEFVILAFGSDIEGLRLALRQAIDQELAVWNADTAKPYPLRLSIGTAAGTYSGREIYDMVKAADQAMYADKLAKRASR